jgi:hypothetical protein
VPVSRLLCTLYALVSLATAFGIVMLIQAAERYYLRKQRKQGPTVRQTER